MKYSDLYLKTKKLVLFLFLLTGATALIYEVIWVRMLGLVFGNTIYAISTVLAGFMAGLAIGSRYFGMIIDKKGSPLKLFALLEVGIGLYAIISPVIFHLILKIYTILGTPQITTQSVLLVFVMGFISILFPAFLMGGTLPILAKWFTRNSNLGYSVGTLYSINTWGAVLGAFATGYVLILLLGMRGTLYFAAVLNIIIAGIIFWIFRRVDSGQKSLVKNIKNKLFSEVPVSFVVKLLLIAVALSGFTALAYEVVWTRVLSMVLGSTVYAFSTMLCSFLAGIAIGSMVYAKVSKNYNHSITNFGFLQAGIGVSVLLLIPIFGILPIIFLRMYKLLGSNFAEFQFVQFILAFGVMLVPTILFGATIPLACSIYKSKVGQRVWRIGKSVGNVYAVNTIGAISGSILAGFCLIPLFGLQNTITIVAMVNIFLAIVLLNFGLKGKKRLRKLAIVFLLLFSIFYALAVPQWNRKIMNSGVSVYADDFVNNLENEKEWKNEMEQNQILFYKEGKIFTTAVKKRAYLTLVIDGKADASSDLSVDMHTQVLLGHLPLLLYYTDGTRNKEIEDVLIIGLGSGVTAGSVAQYPVKKIDCVEIEPAVVAASKFFSEFNHNILTDKRLNIIINDARNYLLVNEKKYPIIISEPSNPWISACSPLFTKESFELVKKSLTSDGIFLQWMHYYDMDIEDFKMVLRTFLSVFPQATLWTPNPGDVLILGTKRPLEIDFKKLSKILEDIKDENLEKVGLKFKNPLNLLSCFLMDTESMKNFVKGKNKINTDNHPYLEFSSPKSASIINEKVFEKNHKIVLENSSSITNYITEFKEHYIMSKIYTGRMHYNQAIEELNILLKENPQDKAVHNGLGYIYVVKKEFSAAEEEFKKAIEIDSQFYDGYVNLARVYFQKELYELALENLEQAIKISPARPEAYNDIGNVYFKLGETELAEEFYSKASSLRVGN